MQRYGGEGNDGNNNNDNGNPAIAADGEGNKRLCH